MDFIPEPKLPYAVDALEPHISKETLEYHHGKHHMAYFNKAKELLQGKPSKPIEDLLKETPKGTLLNQLGQLYNHAFYWQCMAPNASDDVKKPSGQIAELINKAFGSFEVFKQKFDDMAKAAFGSGWVFLVKDGDSLKLMEMHDGECPINKGEHPLLCIDLWEHAYYIDYRNKRPDYLTAWWSLVNWEFVNSQISGSYEYQKAN